MTPGNYRVLLVDDDPAVLRLLSKWLTRAGYSVRTANDGQEAVEAIELECPDFLITDWEMPRLDGLALCRQVREMLLPHYVYVIFLTVRTGVNDMIAGLDHGADDFLTKPATEGELLARMRSSSRVLELERKLNRMAHTDSLTGLLTQRSFYECLEKEWHRARRCHLPLSCVMMDLDYFKQINDVHGHPAGDSVLKFIAELLLDGCRASDMVCRYGGEEFCILLPEATDVEAAAWAERVRSRLASLRTPSDFRNIRLTASFGVAQSRDDINNSEGLVDLADQALLRAKRTGRNCIVRYGELATVGESTSLAADQGDSLFGAATAAEVLTPLAACPRDNATAAEAARFFVTSGVTSSPVLDAAGLLAGFLTEKDLMGAMMSPEDWEGPISDVMRSNVICYEAATPIRVVYEFFCRVSIRTIVVVRDGRPIGTISRDTLFRWCHQRLPRRDAPTSAATPSRPEDSSEGRASASTPRSRDIAAACRTGA